VTEILSVSKKMLDGSLPLVQELVNESRTPDLMIVDAYSYAGFVLARKFGINKVITNSPVVLAALPDPTYYMSPQELLGPHYRGGYLFRIFMEGLPVLSYGYCYLFVRGFNEMLAQVELPYISSAMEFYQ
jgi:hypothetical protein